MNNEIASSETVRDRWRAVYRLARLIVRPTRRRGVTDRALSFVRRARRRGLDGTLTIVAARAVADRRRALPVACADRDVLVRQFGHRARLVPWAAGLWLAYHDDRLAYPRWWRG